MPGPYCQYCGHRCFVLRRIPTEDGHRELHMATCPNGMAHDFAATGYTHETATNPNDLPKADDFTLTWSDDRRAMTLDHPRYSVTYERDADQPPFTDEDAELARQFAERNVRLGPTSTSIIEPCECIVSCADDPATACSLSGEPHVHPGIECPAHPDAPGDR